MSRRLHQSQIGTEPEETETPQLLQMDENIFRDDSLLSNEGQEYSYVSRLKKGIKYVHVNINGLKSKFEHVKELLNNEQNVICMGITETKLNVDRDRLNDFEICNYNALRYDRDKKEGGGLLFYVHHSCMVTEVEIPFAPPNFVQCNIVSIRKQGISETIVAIVYAPPSDVNNQFLEYFVKVCNLMKSSGKRLILMGDFNINLLEMSGDSLKLFRLIKEFDLYQLVNFATRTSTVKVKSNDGSNYRTTQSLLDHIYVDETSKYEVGGIEFGGSDHLLTYIVRNKKRVSCPPQLITYRQCHKLVDNEDFVNELKETDWSYLYNTDYIELNIEIFEKQVLALLDIYVPERSKYVKGQNAPWMTSQICKLIKMRDKHHRLARIGTDREFNFNAFKKLRNEINILIRNRKKKHFKA